MSDFQETYIQAKNALSQLRSDIDGLQRIQDRLIRQHEHDTQALARAGFALADYQAGMEKLYRNIEHALIEHDDRGILTMKVEPDDSYQLGFQEIGQLINQLTPSPSLKEGELNE